MPQEVATAEGILSYIDKNGPFNSQDYANSIGEDHQKIVGLIKSLQGLGQLVDVQQVTRKHWELTDEGRDVARTGSHEAKVFNAVPLEGIAQAELMSSVPNAKIGFSKAVSCGWVRVDKGPAGARICRRVQAVTDVVRLHLAALQDSPDADVSDKLKLEYRKRKLVQEVVSKSYTVSKGVDFTLNIEKPETDLTPEMIASGSWRSKTFKPYNFSALGVPPARGHLHPLLKVRAEFRQIFLEMGFSEMPTNRYVESSFWNFDALFQPQQHPARDAHDTFFISDPATSVSLPADYLPRVKQVHSHGGFGSQGYGYDWKLEEAQKNLLRTHTTAVSARMLRQLAQQKEFRPVKYFSIDRVFRNESLDATHLAEFHQVEGLVADRGLTLGHLMGIIDEFFKKLGIEQIRFKPAYNPYTEPSMEIFSWHAGLGKWVEIGNSGMFRPEMLLPMGLPEDVRVIAWGLSLERPTMIKYKLDNIRDLCGHRVDLQMVANNPICRLDKQSGAARPDPALARLERRQQAVLDELAGLGLMLDEARQRRGLPSLSTSTAAAPAPAAGAGAAPERLRLAVYASPERPPLSVGLLCRLLATHAPVWCRSHLHSSCPASAAAEAAARLLHVQNGGSPAAAALHLTVIWRSGKQLETVVSPLTAPPLRGEAVAARLLARLLQPWRPQLYAENPAVDVWLDQADELAAAGERKARAALVSAVTAALAGRRWLVGGEATLADIVVWSVLSQLDALTPPLKKWAEAVTSMA